MVFKSSPAMLNGTVTHLIYEHSSRRLVHITDTQEYAVTPCNGLPMAERLARVEGVPLIPHTQTHFRLQSVRS